MKQDFAEHYKQVRARLNKGAQIKKVAPPKPIEDYVMPRPQPEVSETEEQKQRRRLKGCPLSMRRQALILPVLEEFDLTWEKLWEKDRRAVLQEPRRKVWLKMWEDGMSLNQIGYYTQRDHTTVLWGLRVLKKAQSEGKTCTTATR
jgi:chromosomal replication initiation ATPase DnaA